VRPEGGEGWPALAVVAPGEVAWPEEAGVWIVDLSGLDERAAAGREEAAGRASADRGIRTLLLDPPPPLASRGGADLAALLASEVDGLDFQVSLPALARYVPAVRRFVAVRVGDLHGERAAFGMELVLDELCLNAIEHGDPHPGRMVVAV